MVLKSKPWFIITTLKGRIKVGYRKSVIHLEWTDSTIKQKADEIFPEETSTKFDKAIHAWGYEKLQSYVTKLLSI